MNRRRLAFFSFGALGALVALAFAAPTKASPGAPGARAVRGVGPTEARLGGPGTLRRGPFAAPRLCPAEMVEVDGEFCPFVEQRCIRWLDPTTQLRCAEFAPPAPCRMKSSRRHFCIDRYEWPNQPGEKPMLMASWVEARNICEAHGKRLCNESEWTVACEGPEHLPYPYGLKRDAQACNIDKPYPEPVPWKVYHPLYRDAEVTRLDQREPSGSRPACVSPHGVHDMAGNVDEWVVNESGRPFQSGLKGGYWGPVRTRCRPMTVAHEETFRYYQTGFRCCGDPRAPSPKPEVRTTWTVPAAATR